MDKINSNTNKLGYEQWKAFCNFFAGANIFEGLLIAELDSYRFNYVEIKQFPELTNIVVDIVIISGTLTIEVDNREYICTSENNNFISLNTLNIIQNMAISDNFKGQVVAMGRLFGIKYFSDNQQIIPIDQLIMLRFNIAYTFEPIIINNIFTMMRKIDRNISRKIFCRTELIIISLAEYFLERLIIQLPYVEKIKNTKSRKFNICSKFCALVIENCRKEHEVSFYADKLCITPQYLTRILQETYNRSAKNIIDAVLISEASALLYSDKSLQQIADILNFADQSSFGKFFKKITGYSPSSFREFSYDN